MSENRLQIYTDGFIDKEPVKYVQRWPTPNAELTAGVSAQCESKI